MIWIEVTNIAEYLYSHEIDLEGARELCAPL